MAKLGDPGLRGTANFKLSLRDFSQGRQPDAAARAGQVMINEKSIDSFLDFYDSHV
ncbi:hypothetical protein [Sanguibacter sp. Leaf3]|uniref:hypothetical protein n=1 Tax=Sanguibacter sp. Leaf3 TaxID=1736209 RepID=UPI000A833B32|nr:hypothetical protein [Sanguibacter sp. Leaf3]